MRERLKTLKDRIKSNSCTYLRYGIWLLAIVLLTISGIDCILKGEIELFFMHISVIVVIAVLIAEIAESSYKTALLIHCRKNLHKSLVLNEYLIKALKEKIK